MTRPRALDPELSVAALILALVLVRFLPVWLAGLTPFWGDLTYIHHPWHAFEAQLVQAGRVPLWNPYLYFGIPQLATMQDGFLYPGNLPRFMFGYASATALHHAFHYWLAGFFCYLWLRSLRLRLSSALGGALLTALGGLFLSRMPFINHLASLSLAPALLLFFGRPWLLGCALALAFLAGYPPMLAGSIVAAWALAVALRRRGTLVEGLKSWTRAAPLALGLGACLLVPALELFPLSRRSSGVELGEGMLFGFVPADLLQWLAPWAVARFNPATLWWKTAYLGVAGWCAVLLGARALRPAGAAGVGLWLALVCAMTLGDTNPLSAALWSHLPLVKFIRYPGNVAYLALPAFALLAAAGLERSRRRRLLLAAIAVELTVYAHGSFPVAPRALFASAGPLVRELQRTNAEHRYLISPRARETHSGAGVFDWKHRLYGLSNAPFKLRAAANFGEPLVPRANWGMMDRLYSAKSAREAAELFPWTDVRVLLTPEPLARGSGLRDEGKTLWHLYALERAPSRALWFAPAEGAALPASIPDQPGRPAGRPLALRMPREDRFTLEAGPGIAAGWAYLAEPLYPGWERWLETERGAGRVPALPALGPFQKIPVPAGPWRLTLRYDPTSWRAGLLLSALSLMLVGAYWYNRARSL